MFGVLTYLANNSIHLRKTSARTDARIKTGLLDVFNMFGEMDSDKAGYKDALDMGGLSDHALYSEVIGKYASLAFIFYDINGRDLLKAAKEAFAKDLDKVKGYDAFSMAYVVEMSNLLYLIYGLFYERLGKVALQIRYNKYYLKPFGSVLYAMGFTRKSLKILDEVVNKCMEAIMGIDVWVNHPDFGTDKTSLTAFVKPPSLIALKKLDLQIIKLITYTNEAFKWVKANANP